MTVDLVAAIRAIQKTVGDDDRDVVPLTYREIRRALRMAHICTDARTIEGVTDRLCGELDGRGPYVIMDRSGRVIGWDSRAALDTIIEIAKRRDGYGPDQQARYPV